MSRCEVLGGWDEAYRTLGGHGELQCFKAERYAVLKFVDLL